MNDAERWTIAIETLDGALWLIKDRPTSLECYRAIEKLKKHLEVKLAEVGTPFQRVEQPDPFRRVR